MRDRSRAKRTYIETLLPYIFIGLAAYEAVLEVLQMGWARNLLRPIVVITLITFYHVKVKGIETKFCNFIYFGLIAALFNEVLSVFTEGSEAFQVFNIITLTTSYIFFALAFYTNISEGKISAGAIMTISGFAPYLVLSLVTYGLTKGDAGPLKLLVVLNLITLIITGTLSFVRNHNTIGKSFVPTAAGTAAMAIADCISLVILTRGSKAPLFQAVAVLLRTLGRYGIMTGSLAHIQFFDIEKKELLGQSLFGGPQKPRRVVRPKDS